MSISSRIFRIALTHDCGCQMIYFPLLCHTVHAGCLWWVEGCCEMWHQFSPKFPMLLWKVMLLPDELSHSLPVLEYLYKKKKQEKIWMFTLWCQFIVDKKPHRTLLKTTMTQLWLCLYVWKHPQHLNHSQVSKSIISIMLFPWHLSRSCSGVWEKCCQFYIFGKSHTCHNISQPKWFWTNGLTLTKEHKGKEKKRFPKGKHGGLVIRTVASGSKSQQES